MTKFLYCFQGLPAKFLTGQERKLVRAAMSKKIPGASVPLDPELYLKKYHVMTYVEDAISFLLERKDEDPKTKPFELLAEYFKSVRDGTHVLFRETNGVAPKMSFCGCEANGVDPNKSRLTSPAAWLLPSCCV